MGDFALSLNKVLSRYKGSDKAFKAIVTAAQDLVKAVRQEERLKKPTVITPSKVSVYKDSDWKTLQKLHEEESE